MWDTIYQFLHSNIFNPSDYDFNMHWTIGGVSISLDNYLSLVGTITILVLLLAVLIGAVVWCFKWFSGLIRN